MKKVRGTKKAKVGATGKKVSPVVLFIHCQIFILFHTWRTALALLNNNYALRMILRIHCTLSANHP